MNDVTSQHEACGRSVYESTGRSLTLPILSLFPPLIRANSPWPLRIDTKGNGPELLFSGWLKLLISGLDQSPSFPSEQSSTPQQIDRRASRSNP